MRGNLESWGLFNSHIRHVRPFQAGVQKWPFNNKLQTLWSFAKIIKLRRLQKDIVTWTWRSSLTIKRTQVTKFSSVYVCMHVWICVCMYVCVCVGMYVCMYTLHSTTYLKIHSAFVIDMTWYQTRHPHPVTLHWIPVLFPRSYVSSVLV